MAIEEALAEVIFIEAHEKIDNCRLSPPVGPTRAIISRARACRLTSRNTGSPRV